MMMGQLRSKILLYLCTWPYYHSLCHYNLDPIRAIVDCHDDTALAALVESWRTGKEDEMGIVKVAVSDEIFEVQHCGSTI